MFNKSSRQETQDVELPESSSPAPGTVQDAVLAQEPSSDLTDQHEAKAASISGDSAAWQEKYQLLQEQFTRLAADFDNYRKRTRDEQESLVKYGAQKSIMELLPVMDNLERATGSLKEDSDPKLLYKSFSMMFRQLMDGLDNMGVKKIQSVGQPFDPLRHEAVSQMSSAEFPEDTIIHETQSGYQLYDKVIRPASVIVSTGSPDSAVNTLPQPTLATADSGERPPNPFAQQQ